MQQAGLPIDVCFQICAYLPKRDLVALQLVNRTFLAFSTSALYREASLDERTAEQLSRTLQAQEPLRPLVSSLRLSYADSDTTVERSAIDLDKLILPLINYCTNLRALDIDWPDELEVKQGTFFAHLPNLPSITSFRLCVPSGQAPVSRLLPALRTWAPRLQSLTIQGLCSPKSYTATFDSLDLPVLRRLSLTYCEISDWAFERLFGNLGKLDDLELDLMVPNAPSDHMVRQVFDLSKVQRLKIEKNWIGSSESQLGSDLVSKCTPGRLVSLSLSGRIFRSDLLALPQMQCVEELELSWVSAFSLEDLLDWVKGLDNKPRPSRLRSLTARLIGYEDDLDQEALQALESFAQHQVMSFQAKTLFGSLEAAEE